MIPIPMKFILEYSREAGQWDQYYGMEPAECGEWSVQHESLLSNLD
jgi:hypothetical protein